MTVWASIPKAGLGSAVDVLHGEGASNPDRETVAVVDLIHEHPKLRQRLLTACGAGEPSPDLDPRVAANPHDERRRGCVDHAAHRLDRSDPVRGRVTVGRSKEELGSVLDHVGARGGRPLAFHRRRGRSS